MELIIFDTDDGPFSQKMHALASKDSRVANAMFSRDMANFVNQLRTFSSNSRTVIILGADRKLLDFLVRTREVFDMLMAENLILVLSDHDPETLRGSHRLHPRFVTFMNGDGDDLTGVLGKIMDQGGAGAAVEPKSVL